MGLDVMINSFEGLRWFWRFKSVVLWCGVVFGYVVVFSCVFLCYGVVVWVLWCITVMWCAVLFCVVLCCGRCGVLLCRVVFCRVVLPYVVVQCSAVCC